jgi:hypothetical protein
MLFTIQFCPDISTVAAGSVATGIAAETPIQRLSVFHEDPILISIAPFSLRCTKQTERRQLPEDQMIVTGLARVYMRSEESLNGAYSLNIRDQK